jgi:hypothetical protein
MEISDPCAGTLVTRFFSLSFFPSFFFFLFLYVSLFWFSFLLDFISSLPNLFRKKGFDDDDDGDVATVLLYIMCT